MLEAVLHAVQIIVHHTVAMAVLLLAAVSLAEAVLPVLPWVEEHLVAVAAEIVAVAVEDNMHEVKHKLKTNKNESL